MSGNYRRQTLAIIVWAACVSSAQLSAQTPTLIEIDAQLLHAVPTLKMRAADLNQDSLTDVVALLFDSADPRRNRIIVQSQLPTAAGDPVRFLTKQVIPARFPQDIALADLDADGDLDLLVVQDFAPDALAIWLNGGGHQQGTPGVFQERSTMISAFLAGAVRTLRIDVDEPRDDVLLIGTIGRPSRLFRNLPVFAGTPALSLAQTIEHPGAIGAEIGDLNGDGRDDIILFGTQTHIHLSNGMNVNPMMPTTNDPFASLGTVFAASLRDLDADTDLDLVLATGSGDLIFRHDGLDANGDPIFALSQSLSGGPPGISRGFVWLDADGDGQEDLVAARDNVNAPATLRGSPVHSRNGISFSPAPTQIVSPSAALLALPLSIGTTDHLWIASSRSSYNGLWRSATAGALPPVASFADFPGPSGVSAYFYGSRIGMDLKIVPAAIQPTTLTVDVSGDAGPVNTLSAGFSAGQRRSNVSLQVPADEQSTQRWDFQLSQVSPLGAASMGTPSQVVVATVPNPFGSGFKLNCYIACVMVALCKPVQDPLASVKHLTTKGSATLMGTPAEVILLQRLRDERLANSSGGQYYIDLYQALQFDLYVATFADPSFYSDLWRLKDAWMPAVTNLVDGDGSMPITAEMRDRLIFALLQFEAMGSEALRAAIARERLALDLAGLAGRPIIEFQQRWETGPIFADSFD